MKKTWWLADYGEKGELRPVKVTIEQLTVRVSDRGPVGVLPVSLSDTPQGALDAAVERAQEDIHRQMERLARAQNELADAVKARDDFAKLGMDE